MARVTPKIHTATIRDGGEMCNRCSQGILWPTVICVDTDGGSERTGSFEVGHCEPPRENRNPEGNYSEKQDSRHRDR